MGDAVWPVRRPDRSMAVAARFSIRDDLLIEAIKAEVTKWVAEKEDLGARLEDDLAVNPAIDAVAEDQAEIRFETTPDSQLWKGLLVDLIHHVTALDGITFTGFYDHIGSTFRPAME